MTNQHRRQADLNHSSLFEAGVGKPNSDRYRTSKEREAYLKAYIAGGRAVTYLAGHELGAAEAKARIDSKTGILNPLGLKEAYGAFQLNNIPTSILFIDLDDFKKINEAISHPSADVLLWIIAGKIAESVREDDVVGRHGGDEFVALLPNTSIEAAYLVAERIESELGGITEADGKPVSPTASIGIAELQGGIPYKDAIESSNTAMYQAKADGRNQISILPPAA